MLSSYLRLAASAPGSIRLLSSATSRAVLVVGGAGALGRAVVDAFNAKQWRTIVADVAENTSAAVNVSLAGLPWAEQGHHVTTSLQSHLAAPAGTGGFDAIVCTAGGWMGALIVAE